jgi:hypothetical protein
MQRSFKFSREISMLTSVARDTSWEAHPENSTSPAPEQRTPAVAGAGKTAKQPYALVESIDYDVW